MTKNVLVTGGNGFLGIQIIFQLLKQGYHVRTTLRSLEKQNQVIQTLTANGIKDLSNLNFIEADLTSDKNWSFAMKDVDRVLSVASPVFVNSKSNEESLMKPAIDGTLRILKAAEQANVHRVVMTSNFGAIGFSNQNKHTITTENDWTNPNEPGLSLYEKSKLLAEKAAWQYVNQPNVQLELTTVNPVAILGPSLNQHISESFGILNNLINGSMKRIPNIPLNIVDVRDVADIQIRAMNSPKAANKRFIASADGEITMPEMAKLIREKRPALAKNIPLKQLPNWMIELGAPFNRQAKEGRLLLKMNRNVSNQQAKELLGWKPIGSIEETILTTVDSMQITGMI